MDISTTPHNNFFHFALSDASNARSLLETQLPPAALDALDLDSLHLEEGSFVDADLREKHSDLLFSVRQTSTGNRSSDRGVDAGEETTSSSEESASISDEALVYLLFEHKSQADRYTVLQLLSYLVRIWEKRLRAGMELCPIIPLVVYHGDSVWSAARSLRELLRVPEALSEFQVDFCYPLLDLSRIADKEIPGNPILRNTLKLLKYSRSRQLAHKLRDILMEFVLALPRNLWPDWIQAIRVYVISVNKNMDTEQYKQTLQSILPTKYVVGSLADKLLTQGREEGRKQGRIEGLREGIAEGLERGKLAGKIQVLAEMLGDEPLDEVMLGQRDLDSLNALLGELRDRLRER